MKHFQLSFIFLFCAYSTLIESCQPKMNMNEISQETRGINCDLIMSIQHNNVEDFAKLVSNFKENSDFLKWVNFEIKSTEMSVIDGRSYGMRKKPLMYACEHRNENMIGFLIKHGADINMRDHEGFTPVMRAMCMKDIDLVKILLTYKPNLDIQMVHQGVTVLMIAAVADHPDILEIILKQNPNLDISDSMGFTALSAAARENNVASVVSLLDAGANPYIKTYNAEVMRKNASQINIDNLDESEIDPIVAQLADKVFYTNDPSLQHTIINPEILKNPKVKAAIKRFEARKLNNPS